MNWAAGGAGGKQTEKAQTCRRSAYLLQWVTNQNGVIYATEHKI